MCDELNIFQLGYSIMDTLPEKELRKVFRKCNEVCKQQFYFKILTEVKISIINGNVSNLVKTNNFLSRMKNEVSTLNCLAYRCSSNNPLRNVNIIILACKYSQPEVLDFILSDKCKILEHWPITVYGKGISPTDIDEYLHNYFYYAIRSGKPRIFEILREKLPDEYKCKKSEKFCNALSNAYRELKWKNVELPIEMEYFVRNEFFEKDFYDGCQTNEPGQKTKKDIKNPNVIPKGETKKYHNQKEKYIANRNIETQKVDEQFKKDIAKRIELVISSIATLKRDFERIDVDEIFLAIAKFIAKNVYVLKLHLKCTYDKIPWAEIEFCLVIFIQTFTESKDNHLFHARNMTKDKLLSYLKSFAECLEETQELIIQYEVKALLKWPTLTALQAIDKDIEKCRSVRKACELRIVRKNPSFEQLYRDYYRLRDGYSLEIIKRYLDVAISVECDETGRIVLSRALQVVGENLKNSLESPKLSDTTCELLLFSLPEDTREIVKVLRNSLSHKESMSTRMKIEQEDEVFFNRVKDDLKKMNIKIVNVLCQFEVWVFRDNLKKIIKCENEEELKEIAKPLLIFDYIEKLCPIVPELPEVEEMQTLLKEFFVKNTPKTKTLIDMFVLKNSLDLAINEWKETHHNFTSLLFLYITFVVYCQRENKRFENKRNFAKRLLNVFFLEIDDSGEELFKLPFIDNFNNLVSIMKNSFNSDFQMDDQVVKELLEFYTKIYNDSEKEKNIKSAYQCFTVLDSRKLNFIEEYNFDIRENKPNKNALQTKPETTDKNLLSEKLKQLKNAESMFKDLTSFKNNRKYQVVVEMLVFDIYSLLKKRLSYNHLFLDAEPVTLIGSNMRNHLAHENLLISILPSCTLIDLALNAKNILKECTLNFPRKIGKVFPCIIDKLGFELEQKLSIIAIQKEMSIALSNGDLETIKNALQKGADVKSRYMQCETALQIASRGTSIETVKLVLREICEFDERDEKGQSALHIAARHGRYKIVEFLIKNTSIFVDQLDRDRKTPLHIAAEHGHLEVVKVLINATNISTTVKDGRGWSPVHYSIENNHKEIVKALLRKEDNVDENKAYRDQTPLFIASQCGHLEIVDYLIKEGANVNAKSDIMEVPLHAAVESGHLEIVRTLIEKGANVNARNMSGTTALHMATKESKEVILRLLLEKQTNVDDILNIEKRSPLSFAAEYGQLENVKLLLKHKATVDMKDVTGKTPLHFAAENGHQSIVEILVNKTHSLAEKQSFLEEQDFSGRTALHYSATNGHESVVSMLLNEGSNIDCIDIYKETPLILAVRHEHFEVCKVLIKKKAAINHTSITNKTALYVCFERQCLDIASLLIERGANIHEKSLEYGITPFHLALGVGSKTMLQTFINGGAKVEDIQTADYTALHLGIINGDLEVIEYPIVDLKCDVNTPSKSGLTALHLAAQESNMEVIELLCQNGSDLNVKDNRGYTTLHYAVIGNNKKIITYLIEKKATMEADLLILAVEDGLLDVVAILLDKGTFDVNAENDRLLHTSLFCRYLKVAEILLEKGANINAKVLNQTHLFLAVVRKDFEMVKLLLDKGADPNLPSLEEEDTPLWAAVKEGTVEIVKILLERGATIEQMFPDVSALHLAVFCGRVEVVNFLLENKYVDVNGQSSWLPNWQFSSSLLHLAVKGNQLEVVKHLVAKGADINVFDANDRTPIFCAIAEGHKDIVEYLYTFSAEEVFGGELAVCSLHRQMLNDKVLYLHAAAYFNQKDILLYFLEKGVYYNAKNEDGKTPLQVTHDLDIKRVLQQVDNLFNAIELNDLDLLNDAIKKGAILNAKRNDNVTPLHSAAWKGYCNIMDVLLDNGANPNIIGTLKETPLHYAAKFGHFENVRSLLSHGAIYNIQSETGKTPLEYSTHEGITRLLSLVDKAFKSVQIEEVEFLEELKTLTDPVEIKSVMKSRNKEKKLLVTTALCHDFPEIKQLKQIPNGGFKSINYEGDLEDYLKICSEVLGHDHPDTLDIKLSNGVSLLEKNDLDKALKLLEENLETRKKLLGDNHVSTLFTKKNLALTLRKLDRRTEALKMLHEVYCQQIRILGETSSEVLETQLLIATELLNEERFEEALSHFRMQHKLYAELYGEHNSNSIYTQVAMASILCLQNKHDDAVKQLYHPYDTHKIIEGKEKHPKILEILCYIANVYGRAGNYDKAIKLYKEVVRLSKTESILNYNPDFPNKLLYGLGYALYSKGCFLEAFKCYIKAKAMGSIDNVSKRMESIKTRFSQIHGQAGRCVLEQMENENNLEAERSRISREEDRIQQAFETILTDIFGEEGQIKNENNLEAEQSRISREEERIQQASDIYLEQQKHRIYLPDACASLEYKEWNAVELTQNHYIDLYSKMSRLRAMAYQDELKETESCQKFIDKDVFIIMAGYKEEHLGIVKKFNNTEFI